MFSYYLNMLEKSRAIVLHMLKYGDSGMIVDMLTESHGRLSFAMRMPKTQKGKLKRQLFQPLSLLEIEFDYRQKMELQRLSDVRLLLPYTSIPFDGSKLSVALFLAEFLYHATRGEQRNDGLFEYIETALRWYDASESDFANFHLVFMIRMSRFVGFLPNVDDYEDGCWFDLRSAQFVNMAPIHADVLEPVEASRIVTLMRMTFDTMHLFRMSHDERNRITDIVLWYYRLHLPQMPDMQSLSVVRSVFS